MPNNRDDVENAKKVAYILKILAKKIVENPHILTNLNLPLEDILDVKQKKKEKKEIFNTFNVYQVFSNDGEQALKEKLDRLEIAALKQIISQNSFDPSNLSRKWRNKDRLVNLIVEKVSSRSEKGIAFKN